MKVFAGLLIGSLIHCTQAYVPKWTPQWNIAKSTFVMPCNDSGYFSGDALRPYAIKDFDWSNSKAVWATKEPMDCEEMLAEQAQIVFDQNPEGKVWVYRNLVKALPWFSSVREKILDPQYSGFFLPFANCTPPAHNSSAYHVPVCTFERCSCFYHDQEQTPQKSSGDGVCGHECDCGEGLPCGEYLWDHRNGSMLQEFLLEWFLNNATGMGNPAIDGFFIDDQWYDHPYGSSDMCSGGPYGGPTEIDPHCNEDMDLNAEDVKAITSGWQANMDAVFSAIVDNGGFAFQMFNSPYEGFAAPNTPGDSCKQTVESFCSSHAVPQTDAVLFGFTKSKDGHVSPLSQPLVDIAFFLLARGDYSFLGYGWRGCTSNSIPGAQGYPFVLPNETSIDPGSPLGLCAETSPNVFTRNFTKASVSLDCNTLTPKITVH